MEDTSFMWSLKKQFIVTLSTCEAEYIAIIYSMCLSFHMVTKIIERVVNATRKACKNLC